MEDERPEVQEPQGNQVPEEATQENSKIDIEEIKKQIMAEFDKKYKSEITGLNRKVSELTTAKMTAEERAAYELKQKEEELLSYKTKVVESTKKELLIQSGIDPGYARFITGDSEDDILDSIKALADLLSKDKSKAKNELLNTTIKRPEGAALSDTVSIEKYKLMSQSERAEWTRKNPQEWARLRDILLKKT